MNQKMTLKDIAQIAGVSTSAVSMALKNHPRIGIQTKNRIIKIAEKWHYQPNHIARSLKSKRSGTFGLVITNIMNPFYPELAKGIEDKAMELGYNIILCSTNYDADRQKYLINTLRNKGVDGIIFSSAEINDVNIKPLVADGFPFVLVNRRIRNKKLDQRIDFVVVDNTAGGSMAIEHLYRLGHRRIAIITGSLATSTALERTEGARKTLLEHGLVAEPDLMKVCNFSKERAYEATFELLSLPTPPTAIFAENDYMALGVRDALLDGGLRIPEDMALVGFDDIEACAIKGVELTTISQKKYDMGAQAVTFLVEKIEHTGSHLKQMMLSPEIMIRKSCGYAQSGGYTNSDLRLASPAMKSTRARDPAENRPKGKNAVVEN
jgi:LacI family transcriptional regulator